MSLNTTNTFTITMKEFNNSLVQDFRNIDYTIYFKEAHKQCFPKVNLSFMDYFISLATQDELFVVPHEKLIEYGVITTKKSSDILRCLVQHELEENIDFTVRHIAQQDRKHGGSNKIVYIVTQDAFKMCLMRAKNSKEYAKYYLLLEKVHGFYHQYVGLYNAKVSSIKDDKIDTLTCETKELRNKVDEQTKKINDLLSRTDHIIEQNDNLSIDNTYLTSKVDQLEETVDDVRDAFRETLDDRNPRPESPALQHYFVLLKERKKDNVYKYIRSQSKTIDKKLRDYSHSHDVIISKRYNANPIDMYNRFKKNVESDNNKIVAEIKALKLSKDEKEILTNELIKNPPIKCRYNDITICLDKISEKDLVQRIEACDSEKLNVVIP